MTKNFGPETIALLTIAAGLDYSWQGAAARPHTDIRTGLYAYLAEYAGNVCAFCGQYAAAGEACHIVSGGAGRRGYMPGNLAFGCRACNEIDAEQGAVVPFESIKRPDLIPTEWPTMVSLRNRGKAEKEANERRKEEIKRMRGIR